MTTITTFAMDANASARWGHRYSLLSRPSLAADSLAPPLAAKGSTARPLDQEPARSASLLPVTRYMSLSVCQKEGS